MPFQRDPLSVEYDDFSAELLSVLREDLYGWHGAIVRSPAADPIDARGLSAHERALQRSVYYVLNGGDGRWVKNQEESLQIRWRDPVAEKPGSLLRRLLRRRPSGPRVRELRCRLTPGEIARGFVPADGYVFNEAEQSQNLNL